MVQQALLGPAPGFLLPLVSSSLPSSSALQNPSGESLLWIRCNQQLKRQRLGPLRFAYPSLPASQKRRGYRSARCEASAQVAEIQSNPFEKSIPDLAHFISQGPLVKKVGVNEGELAEGLDWWVELGLQLCKQLVFDPAQLDEAQRRRVFHYYLPTFAWCLQQLKHHRASASADSGAVPALVIGLTAPQGCGKSTLVEQLELLFNHVGSPCVGISIDDFYLTAAEQAKLASAYPENKLLQYRGNAGSHDLHLGQQTLQQLCNLTQPGATMGLPRYDKSAFGGRGDRAPEAMWPQVKGPLQVVLFEGWMLGFKPLPTEAVEKVDPSLREVNEFLKSYQDTLDRQVDAWIVVQVGDPSWVYKWRLQAEQAMRAKGKSGMTDEQIRDFCERFMPAYKAYLPGLYSKGPSGADPDATLVISIDQDRNVLE